MRLLPQHIRATAGWMPYIWLIFLSYFIADPAFHRFSLTRLLMTIVGMVVFLTLYFFGYWIEGKRKLWIIAGITLLGILYTPWNWGASGFFIYAAAFAGFCGETELAIAILVVLEAAASTVIWYFHLPLGLWVSTSILIAAIGAMNIQHAKRIAAHCRLLVAQEEIEHLAKTAVGECVTKPGVAAGAVGRVGADSWSARRVRAAVSRLRAGLADTDGNPRTRRRLRNLDARCWNFIYRR